jgi:hypothetical protein
VLNWNISGFLWPSKASQTVHPRAFCLFVCLFWWDWGLKSELYTCKAGALLLEQYLQSVLKMTSDELFSQTGLKPWSSHS